MPSSRTLPKMKRKGRGTTTAVPPAYLSKINATSQYKARDNQKERKRKRRNE
jgi:hypothetical protein